MANTTVYYLTSLFVDGYVRQITFDDCIAPYDIGSLLINYIGRNIEWHWLEAIYSFVQLLTAFTKFKYLSISNEGKTKLHQITNYLLDINVEVIFYEAFSYDKILHIPNWVQHWLCKYHNCDLFADKIELNISNLINNTNWAIDGTDFMKHKFINSQYNINIPNVFKLYSNYSNITISLCEEFKFNMNINVSKQIKYGNPIDWIFEPSTETAFVFRLYNVTEISKSKVRLQRTVGTIAELFVRSYINFHLQNHAQCIWIGIIVICCKYSGYESLFEDVMPLIINRNIPIPVYQAEQRSVETNRNCENASQSISFGQMKHFVNTTIVSHYMNFAVVDRYLMKLSASNFFK
eukprot:355552_1